MPILGDKRARGRRFEGWPRAYWSAPDALLYLGDVRSCLRAMPARSVHTCVTSPPYWNLRDYDTGTWEGGSADCDHTASSGRAGRPRGLLESGMSTIDASVFYRSTCGKCGAKRADMQIGQEPSPDCGTHGQAQCGKCFVCSLVSVFREVHRVLRDDATCWLNLGDSYSSGASGQNGTGPTTTMRSADKGANKRGPRPPYKELAPGNLVGVPWRVALALQTDGWVLRNDIIWHSPNKMPESVNNRCSKAHEYIFLLVKCPGYYFDGVAIAEDGAEPDRVRNDRVGDKNGHLVRHSEGSIMRGTSQTVNKRDVWVVPSHGYHGAHFAVYSPQLITPCILAGTSEHGCCADCGAPYERVVATERADQRVDGGGNCLGKQAPGAAEAGAEQKDYFRPVVERNTVGWRKTCGCATTEVATCVVLDPFVGSGTTVATSLVLGRAGVGIDLSEAYLTENAILRIEAAGRGERPPRQKTVSLSPVVPPVPRVLR